MTMKQILKEKLFCFLLMSMKGANLYSGKKRVNMRYIVTGHAVLLLDLVTIFVST